MHVGDVMGRLVKIGDVHGRLKVIEHHHTDSHYRKFWVCQCDCGRITITHSGALRSGNTKSCGCFAKESLSKRRIPENGGEITSVILGYKRHAKRKGREWMLSREQVIDIIARPCHYCGAKPANRKITKNTMTPFLYSGIDRVNNIFGYDITNVVPCCGTCNMAKNDLTLDDFLAWVKRASMHQNAMATQWGNPETI